MEHYIIKIKKSTVDNISKFEVVEDPIHVQGQSMIASELIKKGNPAPIPKKRGGTRRRTLIKKSHSKKFHKISIILS